MSSLKLNTSYRHHLICGLVMAIWLVSFLVLIAPFDASDLSFLIRLWVMPMYGLISLVGYMMLIPIQNGVFRWLGRWNMVLETSFLIIFNVIILMGSFIYYKTDIINGLYSFRKFTLEVYYPIFLIVLPILLFSRWLLNRKAPNPLIEQIALIGDNKMDVLRLVPDDLICISSADNYVEVSYLHHDELSKKLIRSTLRKMQDQVPGLVKVHRSHVINPMHFKEWKDANSIILTHMELPVSKNHKKDLQTLGHSPLKAHGLYQTG